SAFDNKYYRTDPEVRRLESENQRLKEYKVEASKPDEVWEIDVKCLYIHGERRNAFLCSVIDCFTREDLAYHFGRHCLKEDVLRVL
ncbi:MAG: hypothetical protein ACP5H0_07360, partial [Caldisericum sp.]